MVFLISPYAHVHTKSAGAHAKGAEKASAACQCVGEKRAGQLQTTEIVSKVVVVVVIIISGVVVVWGCFIPPARATTVHGTHGTPKKKQQETAAAAERAARISPPHPKAFLERAAAGRQKPKVRKVQ